MQRAFSLLLCAPLLLSACVMEPVPTPPVDNLASCGADRLQYLVGRPGVVLDGMRFSQDVRVIQYGMAVTMDYNPTRLNFWLDRRDVIERVTCG
ncbi:I78 family peptidase inhibitor [Tabrizicola sp.]|uniref:I78 family peptidase inhibitor n=1 Tax=Tabrizicola sp. TaxID=2005166 RepID=UPI002732EADF|nr:I78 family peptidase inhibitor [Tabrizicola sp.]MDP3198143.1 I78 family peptidase inhibitor [Tabrizicola sp.]